jgi:hypothetical protein
MPENKLISTKTNVSFSGNQIFIHTFYSEPDEQYIAFFVPLVNQTIQGINFIGGDLGYTYENVNDIFEINNDGDLIVSGLNADKYSINDNGELIYTE